MDAGYPGGEDASVKHLETPLVLKRGVQGQLQAVIERLFEQCYRQKRYRQVIGIAVEAKSLDVLRRTIQRAGEDEKKQHGEPRRSEELLEYLLDVCMTIVPERGFRNEV
jgi:26S proteasome regulatory subunit N2